MLLPRKFYTFKTPNKYSVVTHNRRMKKFIKVIISAAIFAVFSLSATVIINCNARVARAEVLETKIVTIMYHSVLNGSKGRYIVSEKQLENDLVAFKNEGFVSVTPNEIIAFSEGRGMLPEKPVLITFDDGHYNNLYYAVPILKKHGFTAVINVVGAYSEYTTTSGDSKNPNYSHITWDEMAGKGRRDIFRQSQFRNAQVQAALRNRAKTVRIGRRIRENIRRRHDETARQNQGIRGLRHGGLRISFRKIFRPCKRYLEKARI